MIRVLELTKQNEEQFLDQVAKLEQIALETMKKEGREGQLFITGREDISEYIHSEENTVVVAVDEKGEVKAAAYVTQGQKPFTYNDITKYFKSGDDYKRYIKSQYDDINEYRRDLLDIYKIKLQAFSYAKSKILSEYPEGTTMQALLRREVEENGFHEKSSLRETLNRHMSEFIMLNFGEEIQSKYEQFYWITSRDIAEELEKTINVPSAEVQEYEEMLANSKLTIYEKPDFNMEEYFLSNTQNAVELDTYITAPDTRSSGIARIIVFEGIKKHMEKHFANPRNQDIFLCSTLHRDNYSSKYVSEFFGLIDSLYVKRRQDRDREVHICRIPREKSREYTLSISDKLAVLYGYNPTQKRIPSKVKRRVLEEQLRYEQREYQRLVRARATDKTFKGINVKFIDSKSQKIKKLEAMLEEVNRGDENRDE